MYFQNTGFKVLTIKSLKKTWLLLVSLLCEEGIEEEIINAKDKQQLLRVFIISYLQRRDTNKK